MDTMPFLVSSLRDGAQLTLKGPAEDSEQLFSTWSTSLLFKPSGSCAALMFLNLAKAKAGPG